MHDDSRIAYRLTIKELPAGERPRERLEQAGPGALSNAELLAIILRTGTGGEHVLRMAERLLAHFGGLTELARAGFAELTAVHGVGPAKAAELIATFELGRRLAAASPEARPQVRAPEDAASLVMVEMGLLRQEQLRVILLDTHNRVQAVSTVYVGSLNTAMVRAAEVFREAITRGAAALIAVHNHPSGDPTPSREDAAVTRRLVEAGELLDIEVVDHLIIGRQRFVSMRKEGLGF
ncbi:MAG: DNA repair protein RadC [Anaerolineae bacterium]|nr:DNA repair protein RadC [Anaerolineae bacterium]